MMKLPVPLAPASLMFLAVLSGSELIYEISAPPLQFRLPKVAVRPQSEAPAPQRGFVAPPLQEFSEIDERMVFSPLRKAARSELAGASAGAIADVALMGIVVGPKDRIAVVKTPGSPAAQNVSVGGTVNGWLVTRIEADHIVLHANATGEEVELQMRSKNPGSGALIARQPEETPDQ